MEKNPWFRVLIVLAVLALGLYLGGKVWEVAQHYSDIIIVFFLAWLLAFILTPLARSIERTYRIPRPLASSLVYLFLFVNIGIVFVLIVPLAVDQLVQLAQNLPAYATGAESWAEGWAEYVQYVLRTRGIVVDFASVYQSTDLPSQIGLLGSGLVTNTISVVGGVASIVTNLIIILVLSFYLVLDGEAILERVSDLVPERYQLEGQYLFSSINRTFGGWLRGTLVVAVIYGLGNAAIMAIGGLGFIVLASLIAGLLMIIPLFGPVLAMVLPIVFAVATGDLTTLIVVGVGLLVLQLFVFNVVSPKLMGESVGMHPLLVFFALLIGLKQAGIVGAIFGVPVVGVIWAMFLYFVQKKRRANVEESDAASDGGGDDVRAPRRRPWPIGASLVVLRYSSLGGRYIVAGLRKALSKGEGGYARRVRTVD